MTTKKFYEMTICLWKGSQFDEDDDTKYYANYDTADAAFDTSVKDMYHHFEDWYDSEFILINEEKLVDGTRVCTITGHNEGDETDTDTCKVMLKELKMIID